MPSLASLAAEGSVAELTPSFPCVTCPVQANMTTGKLPKDHGVVANGFYWPQRNEVEMWTSPSDCIQQPQLWEVLAPQGKSSAVWFPLHSKRCQAEYVCTPAPIHNPDGTESLWCYTRPSELYGNLRDELGHFPLKHFWGPLANVKASEWIADSAVHAAQAWQPDFFYIYLPHLDYAAQRTGPESPAAAAATGELDKVIGRLTAGLNGAYDGTLRWLTAGEYSITPVDHVAYPNRVLRQAGLLAVRDEDDGEQLDFANSRAWALVDHQFAHVFVADADPLLVARVAEVFHNEPGIAEILVGEQLARYGLDHQQAPGFARTVDIHRKPGYDPIELFFDPATRGIPLDASLIKGSHGAPAVDPLQQTVILASEPNMLPGTSLRDIDVFDIIMGQYRT
jgi:predicted AlkP superfamily pyrophosphatase or phosphodiesterase